MRAFEREALLQKLSEAIDQVSPNAITRVGIDGVDGAGKTCMANELASLVTRMGRPVVRASVDGFHNPKVLRYARGRTSPEGFYFDSYDYAALKSNLLSPLACGGSRRYRSAIFNHISDQPLENTAQEAAFNTVLLFDGIFLHRPELLACWDYSIFLHVPFEISVPRGASRGKGFGSPDPDAPSNRRYVEGQQIYLTACRPADAATVVIDNSVLARPAVLKGL